MFYQNLHHSNKGASQSTHNLNMDVFLSPSPPKLQQNRRNGSLGSPSRQGNSSVLFCLSAPKETRGRSSLWSQINQGWSLSHNVHRLYPCEELQGLGKIKDNHFLTIQATELKMVVQRPDLLIHIE